MPSLYLSEDVSRYHRRMWFIAAIIFLLEILISAHAQVGFPGPDRYFAAQWTLSYGHVLARRGLPGETLRLLHIDNGNYGLLATLGWLTCASVYAIFARVLIRFLEPLPEITRTVLFVALLMSPVTTGILVQTVGDPIHAIFLGYLCLTLFFIRPNTSPLLSALLFALFGALSILIHEASLFFIGPLLLLSAFFLRRSRADRAALAGYLLGTLPILFLIIRATEHNIAPVVTPLHLGHTPIATADVLRLNSFSSLMATENAEHFHSGLKGLALTVRNVVGASVLPLFFAIVLGSILPVFASSRRRAVFLFSLPVLLSLPLWIIGHDWGRFTSYLFLLTLTAISTLPQPRTTTATWEQPSFSLTLILLAVLAGISTTRALPNYIIKGIGNENITMAAIIIVCAVGILSLPRTENSAADLPAKPEATMPKDALLQ